MGGRQIPKFDPPLFKTKLRLCISALIFSAHQLRHFCSKQRPIDYSGAIAISSKCSSSTNALFRSHAETMHTAALNDFHRLPVKYIIQFKLCRLVHYVRTGRCAACRLHLSDLVMSVKSSSAWPGLCSPLTGPTTSSRELEQHLASAVFLSLVLIL
jgi:hypothetical protein